MSYQTRNECLASITDDYKKAKQSKKVETLIQDTEITDLPWKNLIRLLKQSKENREK